MADDRLTIDYRNGSVRALAHVHLADDEPTLPEAEEGHNVRPPVHRIRLRAANVDSKAALARLIDENSRASQELWLNCDYNVWLKLLKLLHVRAPIPDVVAWSP